MNMLANLKTDDTIKGGETDSLGGRALLDSNAYKCTIEHAFLKASDKGAIGLHLHLRTEDNKEIRQVMYLTNQKGENFYTRENEKHYLPGFNIGNSLALVTTGKQLSDLSTEQKWVKLYDSTAKAEVPTEVPMLMDMVNQEVYVGLLKVINDKTVKNEATGKYDPTGETREDNEIDKFFCAKPAFDKMTTTEIKAKQGGQEVTDLFYTKWVETNKGQVKNKAKGAAAGGTAGAPKAAAAAGSGNKPTQSLF